MKNLSSHIWLDSTYFISASVLEWKTTLKRNTINLDLLLDIDMLLVLRKGNRSGICNAIHWYVKANKKFMKDFDKNKESLYVKCLDENNLYG